MILWLALFLLIITISFILAYQSMRDFHENPKKTKIEYGLFLIRSPLNLTTDFLDFIHSKISKEGLISLERLFKGKQSALVIFGPKDILISLNESLNLLELEDYTQVNEVNVSGWEVGIKNPPQFQKHEISNLFTNMPQLEDHEQFWWQIILRASVDKKDFTQKSFQSQIRAVVFSPDQKRLQDLTKELENLGAANFLVKVPKPYTSGKIASFYQERSLDYDKNNPFLTSKQILQLLILT